jgi:hypothetical protein
MGIAFVSLLDLHAAQREGAPAESDLRAQVAQWLLTAERTARMEAGGRAEISGMKASSGWVAILPLMFVGLISPLTLLPRMAFLYSGRTPETPSLPFLFQRPPPSFQN